MAAVAVYQLLPSRSDLKCNIPHRPGVSGTCSLPWVREGGDLEEILCSSSKRDIFICNADKAMGKWWSDGNQR